MKQTKHEALSIPNLITYFRLLLVPVFVGAYLRGHLWWALGALAVSGLSDVADGYIARHYNMVTDIGKVADPLADKLTQAAMIFCVAWHIPAMWVLLGFLVVKELTMLFWGWYTLRRTGTVNSAKWYGKVCTGVLYASMAVLVLWPGIPETTANLITAVCGGVMLMSIVLYSRWYILFLRKQTRQEPTAMSQHSLVGSRTSSVVTQIVVLIVLVSAGVAVVTRHNVTLDSILNFTPENLWLAALVFLGLFALKSIVAVVYLKLLYIAVGVVFPAPIAIVVNLLGTAVEMTIPYLLGRYGGQKSMQMILQRRPTLQQLQTLRSTNNLRFSVLTRAVGVLPADVLSVYLGASGMPYGSFVLGGVLGLFPSLVITTVMGTQIEDPTSAGFLVSTALFVLVQVAAAAGFGVWVKKSGGETANQKECDNCESAQ
jgi:cardiolipin synthase